jgi:hypothetical protein
MSAFLAPREPDGVRTRSGNSSEALSTLCGGDSVVVFFGMAKPVRVPEIGPAQAAE